MGYHTCAMKNLSDEQIAAMVRHIRGLHLSEHPSKGNWAADALASLHELVMRTDDPHDAEILADDICDSVRRIVDGIDRDYMERQRGAA